jgi:class 3 adenylate cyclase
MSDAATTLDAVTPEPVAAARAALERHSWREAFDLFNQAEAQEPLSGLDLEALSVAAFFAGQADAGRAAKERAFQAHSAGGDIIRSAGVALDLSREYGFAGKPSIAAAWFRRAEKLLDGQPESFAHAGVELLRAWGAQAAGDADGAIAHAIESRRIAAKFGDHDLEAMANLALGSITIQSGKVADGFAFMEEATSAAVTGELSPYATGVSYCQMISACRDLTDYKRASEWTEATERWCQSQAIGGFPGICRVHRAEIAAKGGDLEHAEAELEKATTELIAYNAGPPMADGYYALGETRLRRGDLRGAEEALRRANELGHSPQPVLALIRLAQGNTRAALAAINLAVAEDSSNQLAKTRLLPAQIEIALAAGDVVRATTAVEELAKIVETFDTPVHRATLAEARGRLALADGDATVAARELRAAIKLWREVLSPFEVARDRGLLARALSELGDADAADLELQAARQEFARLGAPLELAAIERAIDEEAERRARPIVARMTFMFTDVVGSTQLAEELGDAAWGQLLRWHDDTLRSLIATHHGRVVNVTGDGFFVAFGSATDAVTCAIDIQRALSDQRRLNGGRLSVRIGLHTADANRRGDDYSGVGVHVAARVSAIAEADEIVASRAALDEAAGVAATNVRSATLKGVAAPVEVATLTWS